MIKSKCIKSGVRSQLDQLLYHIHISYFPVIIEPMFIVIVLWSKYKIKAKRFDVFNEYLVNIFYKTDKNKQRKFNADKLPTISEA